ncbi:MAG TPA: PIG-L family deacetylase [Daejeonella sp.]|nr:PIG-L family deacetylase [Daejeonella sp.]
MKIRKLLPVFIFFFSLICKAQTSPELSASEIKLGLEKLNTLGSVLYIAAHPDDENTRLLTYVAKEKKLRTAYLSLTRGDGGQNLIGNEQAELLGLIRTQELLAARRIDGAEQFFTRANDFGFSKTAAETFKIWNKEQILADAVWVIRRFRPDVIITRFPEDARAGHGQHAASAIIAREAFWAAADPARFPEQLKFVQPWQAKRLLWNTFNFGGTNTTAEDQLKLDAGGYNTLLGKSYGEIAALSRSCHKSQGFGAAKQRGQAIEYFQPVAGQNPKKDLFEDINQSWSRIAGGAEIGHLINQTIQNFTQEDPAKSVPALLNILSKIEKLSDTYWKTQKEKEIKALIAASCGLWFESYASESENALGDTVKILSQFINRSNIPVGLKQIAALPQNIALKNGILKTIETSAPASQITEPYWLAENHPIGMYKVGNPLLIGMPENPEPITVTYTFEIANKSISFDRPVVYKFTDPVRGEVYQPLVIAPPVTASIAENAYIFTNGNARSIQIQLKSFKNGQSGVVEPVLPAGWKADPQKINFNLNKDAEQSIEFTLTPGENINSGIFSVNIHIGDKIYNRGYKTIMYEHIPAQSIFPLAEARLEKVDLKTDGKRIGYLAGAGDKIPEALKQAGYEVILLKENEILKDNLAGYDAIIAGVRAYNVNKRMKFIQPKLMDYVKNGGTYLVQYNTNTPLITPDIGPYPFQVSRNRVTEEDARVTILAPQHEVLNYPNKISEKDFEGWVQERGLYFTTNPAPQYTALLEMHDQDEAPDKGSLIVADYGKGRFIYTSLSFFRQLPAGVPGAYRLFVNLIAKKR